MQEAASLKHHGIVGQKWGVRRYQNPDGSLTPEGKIRYASDFSDTDLEKNAKRNELESRYYKSVVDRETAVSNYQNMIAERNKSAFRRFFESGPGKDMLNTAVKELSNAMSNSLKNKMNSLFNKTQSTKDLLEKARKDLDSLSPEELERLGKMADNYGKVKNSFIDPKKRKDK